MTLRVFTTFSGYDSQCLALDRLVSDTFKYELVGWSEIDRYAIQAHNALYPQWADRNYGDITKIDWAKVPDFDLFTYSSPCQDFSQAGLQRGGEHGSAERTRQDNRPHGRCGENETAAHTPLSCGAGEDDNGDKHIRR